jgi:hypothetical protein
MDDSMWGVVATTAPLTVRLSTDQATAVAIPLRNNDYTPVVGHVVRIVRVGSRLAVADRYVAS